VHEADGTAVPSSALTWSWSFGDGATSTNAAPTRTFARGDDYYVTVQVTDAGAGLGGTATIEVIADTTGTAGTHPHAGTKAKQAKSPSGSLQSSSNATVPTAGKSKTKQSGTSDNSKSADHASKATTKTSAPETTSGAASHRGTSGSSSGGSADAPALQSAGHAVTSAKPPSTAAAKRPSTAAAKRPSMGPAKSPPATSSASEPLVKGRLISDVIPLPPGASPLVQDVSAPAATAPAVRPAVATTILPTLGAALAVVFLLGLGAGRELRGRRDWRALRLPR
jgi:hypothetical protein